MATVEQVTSETRSSKIQWGAALRTWIRSGSGEIPRSASINAALRVAWPNPCPET